MLQTLLSAFPRIHYKLLVMAFRAKSFAFRFTIKKCKIKIKKNIILPPALYGYEAWSLTLREGHRLRVFENKMMRKKFGSKKDEVTGDWRRLHNEDLNDPYFS